MQKKKKKKSKLIIGDARIENKNNIKINLEANAQRTPLPVGGGPRGLFPVVGDPDPIGTAAI